MFNKLNYSGISRKKVKLNILWSKCQQDSILCDLYSLYGYCAHIVIKLLSVSVVNFNLRRKICVKFWGRISKICFPKSKLQLSLLSLLVRSIAACKKCIQACKPLCYAFTFWQCINYIYALFGVKLLQYMLLMLCLLCFSYRYWILRSCFNIWTLWQVSLFIYRQSIMT